MIIELNYIIIQFNSIMSELFGPFHDVFNNTNSSDDNIPKSEYYNSYIIILAFAPLMLIVFIFIIVCFIDNIYDPIIDKLRNIRNKFNKCFKENNLPIKNNILNKSYIDKLNKSNNCEFDNSCSICVENIDDTEFKKKRYIVTLNCKHSFHTLCINEWVKALTSTGKIPVCPTCRMNIVDINTYKNDYTTINVNYDSDSSDYSNRTTLSDL